MTELDRMTVGSVLVAAVIVVFVTITVLMANWPRRPPDD
jgi:hypothetical protein